MCHDLAFKNEECRFKLVHSLGRSEDVLPSSGSHGSAASNGSTAGASSAHDRHNIEDADKKHKKEKKDSKSKKDRHRWYIHIFIIKLCPELIPPLANNKND